MSVHQVDASELFNLLESNDLQVVEEIKTLIHDNLNDSKEAWLLNGLVDYHNVCDSDRARDILCAVREPHDKHLFEKLHDCIKYQCTRLPSLKILSHVVSKQPPWLHRIVKDPLFGLLIKTLKHDNDVPTLNCGLLILCTILPMIPYGVIPYLDSIFEVFSRLVAFTTNKPGNVPQVFLLHLNVAISSFFHKLYGMYPCRFLDYLRAFYSRRENRNMFDETIKPLLERIRFHPLLILSSKEREGTADRWKKLETHDIVIECARMSLDPVEGMRDEWTSRRHSSIQYSLEHRDSSLSHSCQEEVVRSQSQLSEQSLLLSSSYLNTFWSPSLACGLTTPPPSHETSGFHTSVTGHSGTTPSHTHTPHTPMTGMTSTPAPSPWETPRDSPTVDQFERSAQGQASNRSSSRSVHSMSNRQNADNRPLPLSTPKTSSPYIPEHSDALYSPLKREFTNERPSNLQLLSSKTLPEVSTDGASTLVKPTAIRKINLAEFSETEKELSAASSTKGNNSRDGSCDLTSDSLNDLSNSKDGKDKRVCATTEQTTADPISSSDIAMTLSTSERNLLEKLQRSGFELRPSTSDTDPSRQLHVQSLPQIIEQFSESSSADNIDDPEVCNINHLTARSRHTSGASSQSSFMDISPSSGTMTAESVAQFMKNVNRIRFNSMTVKESQDFKSSQMTNATRAQSCPSFAGKAEEGDCSSSSDSPLQNGVECSIEQSNESADEVDGEIIAVVTTIAMTTDVTPSLPSSLVNTVVAPSGGTNIFPRLTRSQDHGGNNLPMFAPRPRSCDIRPPSAVLDEGCSKYPYMHLFPHATPYLSIAECQRCLDHAYISPSDSHSAVGHQSVTSANSSFATRLGTETPLYTTFSPSEILDRHIGQGGEIHAKELSKLPLTSQHTISWTHFGGAPPSDEINILKGQIHLLHNQLMYERHKREMHAQRNRRLLGKVVKITSLEEQNTALLDQLRLQEEELQHMRLSLKLEQEKLRQLSDDKARSEQQKDAQISSLAKDNKDFKYNNNELKKLLVTHKEENDQLTKSLATFKDKVFRLNEDLVMAHKKVALTDQLQNHVNDLTKKVIMQGEVFKKYQEKIRRLTISHCPMPEAENLIEQLKEEVTHTTQQLNQKILEVDLLSSQLSECQDVGRQRDLLIAQLKREMESVKSRHVGLLEAAESKYQSMRGVNTSLETYILQLQEEIAQLKNFSDTRGAEDNPAACEGQLSVSLNYSSPLSSSTASRVDSPSQSPLSTSHGLHAVHVTEKSSPCEGATAGVSSGYENASEGDTNIAQQYSTDQVVKAAKADIDSDVMLFDSGCDIVKSCDL